MLTFTLGCQIFFFFFFFFYDWRMPHKTSHSFLMWTVGFFLLNPSHSWRKQNLSDLRTSFMFFRRLSLMTGACTYQGHKTRHSFLMWTIRLFFVESSVHEGKMGSNCKAPRSRSSRPWNTMFSFNLGRWIYLLKISEPFVWRKWDTTVMHICYENYMAF
jgi:hypothetical protein